ncbi:MAG: HlyC/CorC family transporter [Acholeplasmataceae bacterium]|jgi:putative hemolysin|nr:HlyC/CorC family transporter [Acholeplasmataceae bacterium]
MIQILIIIILILFNAFFTASETALVATNDSKVEADAQEGNKRAKRVYKYLNKPTNFLSAIQLGITLIGFINGFIAADTFAAPITSWIQNVIKIQTNILQPIVTFLITLVLAFFQIVFGELVPKRLAMKYPEKIIYVSSGLVGFISKVMRPFVWLLTASANLIVRLFGIDPDKNDKRMTEEEIRLIVASSGKKGVIDATESEMIENILDFDDIAVSEVMTHRKEISALDINSTKQEVFDFVINEKYTRFPVYDGNIDKIIGILHAKDLLKYMGSESRERFNLKKLLRQPIFVPESAKTNDLLNEMRKKQTHIAIVIDEYGGTAGIITIEDLLEEIVGNIFDEYDVFEEEIEEINKNEYIVDGLIDLDDVENEIKADLPIEEYDTLSGFVLGQLGRFPEENEKILITYNGYLFEALEYDEMVITKVKIKKIEVEESETESKSE